MLIAAILIAEILFWACLLAGLVFRYMFKLPKIGIFLLILTPVIDIALIGFTFWELSRTGTARFMHGVAAFYIGLTVSFGPRLIAVLDQKFLVRFGSGESERVKGEKKDVDETGPERRYRQSFADWKRCVIGALLAGGILGIGFFLVDSSGIFWLIYWEIVLVFTVITWGLIGPWRAHRNWKKGKNESASTRTRPKVV